MSKVLPNNLTSYDLLKSLAIILMIIDHVGYHFFPDEAWFRVMGRLCLPIWFFLIGYAETDKVPKTFWIGGVVLVISALISGQYLFPLNILFTMAALRLYRSAVVQHSLYSPETLRGMFFILFFLGFPTALLVEYGATAMLMALVGYIARRRETIYERIPKHYVLMYVTASFAIFYFVLGTAIPNLNAVQALFLMVGFAMVGVMLWKFQPVVYEDSSRLMAPSFIKLFQFMGRRSLEIYVVHLVIFRFVAMYMYPEKFKLLEWDYIPASMISMFVN